MTPEPSNEYQKLVEAVARAICCHSKGTPTGCAARCDGSPFSACQAATYQGDARAALSALKLPHVTEQMVERGWSAFVMAMGDIEKDVLLDDMTPDEERAIVRAILVHALALSTPPAGVRDNA